MIKLDEFTKDEIEAIEELIDNKLKFFYKRQELGSYGMTAHYKDKIDKLTIIKTKLINTLTKM